MVDDACLDIVRAGDKDTFLATLFAPEAVQPHLMALHAFAIEVARIPLLVSEPQIGEIRLQWWADTLAAIATGDMQSHPVAKALSETVRLHTLPVAPLQSLIEARRFDLYADVLPDLTAVEAYFGETRSILFQLSCMILQPEMAVRAAAASGFAGVAFGLARSLIDPVRVQKFLPPGTTPEALAVLADRRLSEARAAMAGLPAALFPAFMPLAVTPLYLAAARAGKSTVAPWRRQWQIWKSARREKI